MRIAGWLIIVAGVGMIIAGIAMHLSDDRTDRPTEMLNLALLILGAAALPLGGIFLVGARIQEMLKSQPNPSLAPQPLPDTPLPNITLWDAKA